MPFLRSLLLPLCLLCAAALGGCSNTNPYYDPHKPHHTPEGFRNNYPPDPAFAQPQTGFIDGLRTRIRIFSTGEEARRPRHPILPVTPDLAFLRANRDTPSVTWIGHATVLVQTGSGLNLLTDPIFEERASPFSFAGPKREQPPGVALEALPHIDAVLLSHSHYDHLSRDSLRKLYAQPGGPPLLFAPLGIDRWLAEHVTGGDRSRIVRLDWWDKARLGDAEIHLLPVQHWSARTPWDRNETLWGGYAVRRPGFSFFFSGDLGFSRDIEDIAARFDGFDVAAIAIGAYEPLWFRNSHVNPEEALRIHRILKVKRSIGIHWGTFPLGFERLDQAPEDLAAARQRLGVPDDAFVVLRHGETMRLAR